MATSKKSAVKRLRERGCYEDEVVEAILDENYLCHVGFVFEDHVRVIPTCYGRDDRLIYLHGNLSNQMLKSLIDQEQVVLEVTSVDGIVCARSHFHHSINYRSVVGYGRVEVVEEGEEKRRAMKLLVDHIIPGRADDSREGSEKEMKLTKVLRVEVEEWSAKMRTGDPHDDDEDYQLPYWCGVIPTSTTYHPPINDPTLDPSIPTPSYISNYKRPTSLTNQTSSWQRWISLIKLISFPLIFVGLTKWFK